MSETAEASPPANVASRQAITIEARQIAWAAAALLFLALRIGPTWQAPVSGTELQHLAGAWQASIGFADDSRFASTLFQALSAFLLKFSDSEVPSRVMAVLVSLSVPLAVYRLRSHLGEAAAIVALFFIAIDPLGIFFTTAATALGFDVAIAAWLFVLLVERPKAHPALLAATGFAIALSGPLVLSLALAAVVLHVIQRGTFDRDTSLTVAGGAVVGLILATANFGLGSPGFKVPAFQVLGDSFDEPWSSPNTAALLGMYSWPLAAGGLAYSLAIGRRLWSGQVAPYLHVLLLAWFIAGAAWFVASGASHSPIAVLGLTLPASVLAAIGLCEVLGQMQEGAWRQARYALAAGVAAGLIAMMRSIEWARVNKIGGTSQRLQVVLTVGIAIVSLAYLLYNQKTRPVVALIGLAAGLVLVLSGTFGVGLSGSSEPLLSPLSTVQARQLRDRALQEAPNSIGVHPSLEEAITWPFRDSGDIVVTTQPGDGVRFLIWPSTIQAPDGYVPLEGTWSLESEVTPPTRDGLVFIKWLSDRNGVAITSSQVGVYLRAGQ